MEVRDLVAALEGTWAATSEVLSAAGDHDWDRATGCPGWTVRDQLSHMVWSARLLNGKEPAEVDVGDHDHLHSDTARYMERDVQARRGVPGPEVLAEFDEERVAAIADLRSRLPDGIDEPFPGPMGVQMPRSRYLPISVFDQWAHGQDIRAALDRPGDLDGLAADNSFAIIAGGLARAGHPVRIELTGPGGRSLAVGDGEPVATIRLPAGDLVTLATGRDRPTSAPVVEGDEEAARAVLALGSLTP